MKRGKPIPQRVKMDLWDRCGGLCEAGLTRCTRVATDPHHIKKRSAGGSNALHNLLAVCRNCHDDIENCKPGTAKFRTFPWQEEGERANGENEGD